MNVLFINYNDKIKLIIKRLIINSNIYVLSKEKHNDFLEYDNIKYISHNEIEKYNYDYIIFNIDENLVKSIYDFEKYHNKLSKFLNIISKVKYKRCILLLNGNIKYLNIYKKFYLELFTELKKCNKKTFSIIEYRKLNINNLFNMENIINYKEKFRYKKV